MRKRLSHLRSESGAINAGTAITLALVAAVVYIGLAAVNSDTAYFGEAPVPGTSAIDLDKGGVEIYYAQGTSAQTSFQRPANLTTTIRDSAGTPLRVDVRGADAKETDTGMTQLIASVQIPADGIYTVETSGTPSAGAVKAELTFGQSPMGAVASRAKDLAEQLIGPLGVLVLIFLGVLYALPRIKRRTNQSSTYNEF